MCYSVAVFTKAITRFEPNILLTLVSFIFKLNFLFNFLLITVVNMTQVHLHFAVIYLFIWVLMSLSTLCRLDNNG